MRQISLRSLAAAGALLAALMCAAPASARIIEVGVAPTEASPSCPSSPCAAVARTTGYQTKVVDDRNTFIIPRAGRIVAWTVSLGNPDESQIEYFEDLYGAPSARLTILRRGERLYSRVVAQSPVQPLGSYLGQQVQFPLEASIPVRRGQMLALTVPTWAPALSQLLDDGSFWRASRPKDGCGDNESQTAQSRVGQLTQYRCLYPARLTFSATLITNPRPNPEPERPRRRERQPS